MPNFLSKLFRQQRAKSVTLTSGSLFSGFEHHTDAHTLRSYQDSLYLFIGVSLIAKHAAGIELELYRIKNIKGETEEVLDHDVLDLLNNPNPLQSRRELFETSFAHYCLAGDVLWYIDPVEKSLYTLRPDLVEVVLSSDKKRVVAYEYRSTDVQRFLPEDIIHIKNPDPSNVLRGIGAVRPASVRIITEQEASTYQANFFKNQGRPDVAVFVDRDIDQEEGDAARAKWQSIFGRGKGGQAGFFGSDIKDIRELNKTPKEMDFIASQHFLRDDILAALHVPKAMVTTDDVNLANSKEAYRMFLQEAVVPVVDAFVDTMNYKLLPKYDESLFFSYEDPTPNDREMKLKETTQLKQAGIITANEARELYNYEVMEGADVLATPAPRLDVQQEARSILRTRRTLVKKLKAVDAIASLTVAATEPVRQMNSIFPTKALKESYAKAFNEKVDRKAKAVKAALDEYHSGLLGRILKTDLTPSSFMSLEDEKRLAKAALTPILVKLYTEGGQEALDAIFKKSADRFFADAVLIAAIEGRVAFFTNSMTETTYEILKGKILTGIAAGEGIDVISASIRDTFTDMSVGRANTIARTETGYTLSKATNDAYNQSSIVTGKEWITAGDSKVRDEHVMNDGQVIAKGGTFSSGEEYPGQHSINCRCVLAPAV